MTAQERAAACLNVMLKPDGRINWGVSDSIVAPGDVHERIVAHIRLAVNDALERAAAKLEAAGKDYRRNAASEHHQCCDDERADVLYEMAAEVRALKEPTP